MRWYVVTNGLITKCTELVSYDKQALLEEGYRIICNRNGYDSFNGAFVSMMMKEMTYA